MFILKTGHQPGVYVPLRALFLVINICIYTLFQHLPCDHSNIMNQINGWSVL